MTASTRLPEASLLEEWTVSRTQHWARTSGVFGGAATSSHRGRTAAATANSPAAAAPPRPEVDQFPDVVDAERASRRAEHLLRLAVDDRATAHERALAAERAAVLLRRIA